MSAELYLAYLAACFVIVIVPVTAGEMTIVAPNGERSKAQLGAGKSYFRKAGVEHDAARAEHLHLRGDELRERALHRIAVDVAPSHGRQERDVGPHYLQRPGRRRQAGSPDERIECPREPIDRRESSKRRG